MNTRGLLDQLLKSGQDMLQNKAGGQRKSNDKGALGGLLNGGGLGSMLGGAGGGALAAGAMGLLLGNKKARSFGGKALTYSGLAALGVTVFSATAFAALDFGAALGLEAAVAGFGDAVLDVDGDLAMYSPTPRFVKKPGGVGKTKRRIAVIRHLSGV